MTIVKFIRYAVFGGISQQEFAKLIGRRQATVSYWEQGKYQVRLDDLQAIRQAAKRRKLPWTDSLPFMSDAMLSKRAARFSRGG